MTASLRFVSAGAGSGKTYRLTQILLEKLASGQASPGGVMATTFTRKAAAELRERVRSALIERGDFERALAVAQARIGTVNSLCGGYLERFAFEAGLSPQQRVLDEAQSAALVRQAIDEAGDPAVVRTLVELARCLGIEHWEEALAEILAQARANDIAPERLAALGQRNARELLAHFPAPCPQGLDEQLVQAIESALPALRARATGKKNTEQYLALASEVARRVGDGAAAWSDWVRLAKAAPEAALQPLARPVADVAAQYASHPRLRQDLACYLRAIFTLAGRALQAYEARKRELGVLDFVDQEHLFLGLLDKPEVVDVLEQELELLLVDEFQDTSPIQLEIFVRLSRIARETVWVGDVKQAIYGFRGSDAELMKAVLAGLEARGGTQEVLAHSRRARPHLVRLVNAAFGAAFEPALSRAQVELEPVRPEQLDEAPLAQWALQGRNEDERAAALAQGLRALLASGRRVVDRASEEPRAMRPGDIVVLCKTNAGVQQVAQALRAAALPWATQQAGLLSTPEAALALACLRRFNDPCDTLASAEIAMLGDGEAPESWLADRLRHLAAGGSAARWRDSVQPEAQGRGTGAHPLLARLSRLRRLAPVLAPRAALELVITQCDLPARVLRWRRDAFVARLRLANLQALLELAARYEDVCSAQAMPATVAGLILWFGEQARAQQDLLAKAPVDAVQVMTHHAAKGLEWPVVVLLDLEDEVKDRLWAVGARSEAGFDAAAPLKDRWIRYWPWPFGRQRKVELGEAIARSDTGRRLRAEALDEARRLLYVSMTRARDALVLAFPARRGDGGWLASLNAPWLAPEVAGDVDGTIELPGGSRLACAFAGFAPPPGLAARPSRPPSQGAVPTPAEPPPLHWFPPPEACSQRPAAILRPSAAMHQRSRIVASTTLGERLALAPQVDMNALGVALHVCIATAFTDAALLLDEPRVARILEGFGLAGAVDAGAVLRQVDALQAWIRTRWAAAKVHAEVPIEALGPQGQVVQGRIDLLLDLSEGWVLLDHKASPAAPHRWGQLAQEHGGQLALYADALGRATGRAVTESWLVLPVAAGAIRLAAGEE
jgi:ATP-dependent exoDNAse (exonuclease V) beta subunit